MNSSSKTVSFLTSYEFFSYLLATALLSIAPLMFLYKIEVWDVLTLVPSKVFIVLIFLNRFFGLVYEVIIFLRGTTESINPSTFLGNNPPSPPFRKGGMGGFEKAFSGVRGAVVSIGILIIIGGLILNYLYRFEGIVGLGEGEDFIDYDSVEKGPLSKPPKPSFLVKKIEGDPLKLDKKERVEISYDKNKPILLSARQSARLSSSDIKVIKVEPAPRFLITDEKGKELHSAFVKLNLYPQGKEDYFHSPAVPHRFYLSLTGKADKPFNLKIVRGKLIIENKEIASREEVAFERLKISFPEISKWAEIKVSYYPGNNVIFTGIVVIIAGVMLLRLRKHAAGSI